MTMVRNLMIWACAIGLVMIVIHITLTELWKDVAEAIGIDRLLHMYRQMVTIRLFKERAKDLYTRTLMPRPAR
jgi:TPP-dependent pyruvate/acetoin dehydrogenase alpha subunit